MSFITISLIALNCSYFNAIESHVDEQGSLEGQDFGYEVSFQKSRCVAAKRAVQEECAVWIVSYTKRLRCPSREANSHQDSIHLPATDLCSYFKKLLFLSEYVGQALRPPSRGLRDEFERKSLSLNTEVSVERDIKYTAERNDLILSLHNYKLSKRTWNWKYCNKKLI